MSKKHHTKREHGHYPVLEMPPANILIPPQPITAIDEAIRLRAYHLWEEAGHPNGEEMEFWLQAERELIPS